MNRHLFNYASGSPLSNFYNCELLIWGKTFSSSEQGYQYFKAVFHELMVLAEQIRATHDPKKVYRLGKAIVTSKAWEAQKVGLMLHILRHKWWQSGQFRAHVELYKDCVFTEDTRNAFWGIGRNGDGINTLGVLLHVINAEAELQESV